MPLLFSPTSLAPPLPSLFLQNLTFHLLHPKLSTNTLPFKLGHHNFTVLATDSAHPDNNLNFADVSFDWDDVEEIQEEEEGGSQELEDMDFSPWEGAIVYKRNPSVSHLEYCTTLERLGLSKLSSGFSKSRASTMGLRVTKSVKDYPSGTPVQVSIDVTRKKQKLRLDGIIKTVITLSCNRCGEPAAECIYTNFAVLLTEEPIEEPDIIDMGTIFGVPDDKVASSDEDDDDASIDWDDRFHFPSEEKEIDISKNIRDLVHVEITMNAVCDPKCRGICLKCGTNLNSSSCSCSKEDVKEQNYGPLKNLRKRMDSKR